MPLPGEEGGQADPHEQTRAEALRQSWHEEDPTPSEAGPSNALDSAISDAINTRDAENTSKEGVGVEDDEAKTLLGEERPRRQQQSELASPPPGEGVTCFGKKKDFGTIPTSFYTMVLPVMVRSTTACFSRHLTAGKFPPWLIIGVCLCNRWSRVCLTRCRPSQCYGSSRMI